MWEVNCDLDMVHNEDIVLRMQSCPEPADTKQSSLSVIGNLTSVALVN